MTGQHRDGAPLEGIRVLGAGDDIGTAYAVRLLVDLGADATIVEPAAIRTPADVLLFDHLRRDCVLHRLDDDGEAHRLSALAADADIVIVGPGCTTPEAAGRTDAQPQVTVHLSPYGRRGPYSGRRAAGLTLQAGAGWSDRLRDPGDPPVFVGGEIAEFAGGVHAAVAALTAWRHSRVNGSRADVDVSTFECLVGMLPYPTVHAEIHAAAGLPDPRFTRSLPGVVECLDGWVGVNPLNQQGWNDLVAVMDLPEFADRLREVLASDAATNEFRTLAAPWFHAREVAAVVDLCQAIRVPSARVVDGEQLLGHPQLVARGTFERSSTGGYTFPRAPWRFAVSDPAPAPSASGAPWGGGRAGLPYHGLKVVDLGTYWAGPIISMFLGAFGADVIKIESRSRPDPFRYSTSSPALGDDWWERSAVFQGTNLDKRSLTLDLTTPEGQDLARRVIAEADVLVENYSPRVLSHLGIEVDAARAANPALVVLRMPAFGLDGPFRDHIAWAPTFEQSSGMAAVTGTREGPPVPPGGCADPFAGMHGVLAIQAALEYRDRSRVGSSIEMAQLEALIGVTAAQVIASSSGLGSPGRDGNRHPTLAPHGIYPCDGPDEWIAVAVREDEWTALTRVLGRPDLEADADLAASSGRRRRHDDLDDAIAVWTGARSADDAVAALVAGGVTASRVVPATALRDDPHLDAVGYFQAVPRPATATYHYPGWPMHCSFGPSSPHGRPAPTLGQHTNEILHTVLGLTSKEITDLERRGVI